MNDLTISTLRILLTLGMLTYSSYEDIRIREVHDIVWILFGLPGLIIALFQMRQGVLGWRTFLLSISVSIIFSAVAWLAKLFGEADLLALIALTIIHPIRPQIPEPVGLPGIIFPLTVLTNSALIGASSAFIFLTKNLSLKLNGIVLFQSHETEGFIKKLTVLFTGSLTQVKQIRGPPFQYPLETIDQNKNRVLLTRPNINDDQEARKIFENFYQSDTKFTWVSNTLPFLFVIFLGYLTSLFLGDIILSVLFSFP